MSLILLFLESQAEAFVIADSANVSAGGVATTARLTPPATKSTADFQAGKFQDDSTLTPAIDLASGKYTELEWPFKATNVVAAEQYEFRIVDLNEVPLDTYSVTPIITIAGGGAYTLTANSGTFNLAGTSAAFKYGRVVSAANGSFTIGGTAATLKVGRRLAANVGAFNINGQSAGLLANRRISASNGIYSISGQAANLIHGYKLVANNGSFLIGGQSANLLATRRLTATIGVYTINGQAASLRKGRTLAASNGIFSFNGIQANLLANRLISGSSGTFLWNGIPATLIYSGAGVHILTANGGSFIMSGTSARTILNLNQFPPIGTGGVAPQIIND